ncbi:hypothetical protein DL98DRAFT_599996 [Cadophora sp. DSE1049]|nr:hypothetical protein DL98DRAFT_599996 [Cadophora sp. DSE1049]
MGPISSRVEPKHLEWTQGPEFDSEIRVDITIVTDKKIFYQLDVHLKLIAKHDVGKFQDFDIVCHGFHSDVLVLGSEVGQIHILDLKRQTCNSVLFSRQSVSTISIDENHIMVGSFCGDIGWFDRSGRKIFEYRSKGGYIYSVSIYGGKILATDGKTIYLWKIKNQLPSSLRKFPLESNDILWACLKPSRRKLYDPTTWITKPYLVGETGPPVWDKPCRPIIPENVPMRKLYALTFTASVLKVRNLKHGCFVQNFRFDKGREYVLMLWSAQNYVYRVIDSSKVIERAALSTGKKNVNPSYCGSVDLRMDDGP